MAKPLSQGQASHWAAPQFNLLKAIRVSIGILCGELKAPRIDYSMRALSFAFLRYRQNFSSSKTPSSMTERGASPCTYTDISNHEIGNFVAGDETLRFWNVFPGPRTTTTSQETTVGSMMRTQIR